MILLEVCRWLRSLDEVEPNDDREMIVCGPALVFCKELGRLARYDTIAIISGVTDGDAVPGYVCEKDGDEFHVLQEEEWPEIAVEALAKLALLGRIPKNG
jgi:hypothetical protein